MRFRHEILSEIVKFVFLWLVFFVVSIMVRVNKLLEL